MTAPDQDAHQLLSAFVAAGRPADWCDRLPAEDATCRRLSAALDHIGIEAFNAGDLTIAKDAFWNLFLLRLSLVRANPSSRGDIRDFASAQDLLGQAALQGGDIQTAGEMLQEACSYRERLHGDDTSDVHAAYLYGVGLWHLSWIAAAKGNTSEELALVRRARVQLEPLDAAYPGVAFITDALGEITSRMHQIEGAPSSR